MNAVDRCLLAAVADVRAFNDDAASVTRLVSHPLDPDTVYRVLDAAEVLTHLMAQAFIRIGLAVGQSLSLTCGDDLADIGMADLTAAAVHMAEASQLISAVADKVAPLVDRDSERAGRRWRTMGAAVRNWAARSLHQVA